MQQSIYHVYEIKHKLKYQMNFVNEKSSTLSRDFAKLTRAFLMIHCFVLVLKPCRKEDSMQLTMPYVS